MGEGPGSIGGAVRRNLYCLHSQSMGVPTEERRAAASEFLARLRQRIPERVVHAWLYGSVARGDDRPSSDVDILLVLDRRDPPTLDEVYTLAETVSVARSVDLSLRIFAEREYRASLGSPLLKAVASEGIALA